MSFTFKYFYGCVQLASPCRPCGAHLVEPLTRANRTISHPLVVMSCNTRRALGTDLGEPLEWRQSYSSVLGADRVDLGKVIECAPFVE